MNIVFPGFAIDLFLMSHNHFCTPTLEQGTWLRCHLGTQIPFSWMFYHCVNMCCVLGCFVGWWQFYFSLVDFLWVFFFATDGCCICCFLHGLLQASLNMAVFYCSQAILEKELCWFLQLKTKHCQCWCFSSGTEIKANSGCFIQPWDQKLP